MSQKIKLKEKIKVKVNVMKLQPLQQNKTSLISFEAHKAYKAANEFEALFVSFMLKAMRKTVNENSLIPISIGQRIYTDMLDAEYSKVLSASGSLGLANLILEQLQKSNENLAGLDLLRSLKNNNQFYDNLIYRPVEKSPRNSLIERIGLWRNYIEEAGEKFSVDKNLIAAVIAQESGGNPYAVSTKGAKGLMQLMDSTAAEMGVTNMIFNPKSNIFGGVKYLKKMLNLFGGDERLALASYNAGPQTVQRYGGIPPYKETQQYVASVLALRNRFEKLGIIETKKD